MLFILGKLTLTEVGESVMLVVLAEVESHTLTLDADTHWDEVVDEPIAEVAHGKGVDEHDGYGKQVIEEYHEAVPCSGDKSFLNEYSGHDGTYNTARSVGREYVEGIVYPTV